MGIDYEIKNETPFNVNDLVKKANDKNSWRNRLEAINELRKWNCQQSRDVLIRLTKYEKAYGVRYEAFLAARALNIKTNGKNIQLRKNKKLYKSAEINSVFLRAIIELEKEDYTMLQFKEKFSVVNPEMYDLMKYYEKDNFDQWIYKTLYI